MTPVDPTEITDILADPAEDELRALGTATAALGDRHAVAPFRLVPRACAAIDRRDLTDRTEIVDRIAAAGEAAVAAALGETTDDFGGAAA